MKNPSGESYFISTTSPTTTTTTTTTITTTIDQFKYTEIWLRFSGVWPDMRYRNLIRIFWILDMFVMQYSEFYFIFSCIRTVNWADWMNFVSMAMVHAIIFFKMLLLWLNERIFNEILIAMKSNWYESVSDNRGIDIIMTKTEVANFYSKLIVRAYQIFSCLYVASYFVTVGYTKMYQQNSTTNDRLFLYQVKFPFDQNKSPYYELIIFFQIMNTLPVCGVNATLNCLILILILHVGGQIEIINEGLSNIARSSENKKTTAKNAIIYLIEKHQKTIDLSKKIELLFSNIVMVQFFTSTVIICVSLFIVIITIRTNFTLITMLKFILYYITNNMETFVLCSAGEYLSNKSLSVVDAVYNSLWYNLKPSDTRLLSLMILRGQRQLIITAAKITTLSLECFAQIIKASASYLSLLLAIY